LVKQTISISLEEKLIKRINAQVEDQNSAFSSRSRLIEFHLINVFFPKIRKEDVSVLKI